MADTKRCPHCGGLNPVAADWCGQCLERFTPPPAAEPEPSPEPVVVPAKTHEAGPDAPAPAAPAPPRTAAGIAAAAVGTTHGVFTVREHGVVWTCSRCDNENPLEAQVCEVCGTKMADVVEPPPERPERDPGTAAMVSLFFPGAGHGYLGLWGQAVARGVLHLWVVMVVLVSLVQRGEGGSTLIGIVFGLVATALWVASAHDAYREARKEPNQALIKGKVFLYLVLGLLMLLMVMLTASGLSARG